MRVYSYVPVTIFEDRLYYNDCIKSRQKKLPWYLYICRPQRITKDGHIRYFCWNPGCTNVARMIQEDRNWIIEQDKAQQDYIQRWDSGTPGRLCERCLEKWGGYDPRNYDHPPNSNEIEDNPDLLMVRHTYELYKVVAYEYHRQVFYHKFKVYPENKQIWVPKKEIGPLLPNYPFSLKNQHKMLLPEVVQNGITPGRGQIRYITKGNDAIKVRWGYIDSDRFIERDSKYINPWTITGMPPKEMEMRWRYYQNNKRLFPVGIIEFVDVDIDGCLFRDEQGYLCYVTQDDIKQYDKGTINQMEDDSKNDFEWNKRKKQEIYMNKFQNKNKNIQNNVRKDVNNNNNNNKNIIDLTEDDNQIKEKNNELRIPKYSSIQAAREAAQKKMDQRKKTLDSDDPILKLIRHYPYDRVWEWEYSKKWKLNTYQPINEDPDGLLNRTTKDPQVVFTDKEKQLLYDLYDKGIGRGPRADSNDEPGFDHFGRGVTIDGYCPVVWRIETEIYHPINYDSPCTICYYTGHWKRECPWTHLVEEMRSKGCKFTPFESRIWQNKKEQEEGMN